MKDYALKEYLMSLTSGPAKGVSINSDIVLGDEDSELFWTSGGNDVVRGGNGSDTYVYARGDGSDTIDESSMFGGTADKLLLVGINPADVQFGRNGEDAVLTIKPSTPGGNDGGRITLTSGLGGLYETGVETVVFADGTVLDRAAVRARVFAEAQTKGDDVIVGTKADDTYVYARGDGNDTFDDSGTFGGTADKLLLFGITPDQVGFESDGKDGITLVIAPSTPGGADGGRIVLTKGVSNLAETGIETPSGPP